MLTMSAPDLGMFLLAHKALRRDVDALVTATRRINPHIARDAEALLVEFTVNEEMLLHHHAAEDTLVWPALKERRPACASEIDELESEHGIADRWLAEVREALTILARPDAADRYAVAADLIVAATALAGVLNAHLDHEERVAVPLITEALTAEDWERIDARRRSRMTPGQSATALAWILSVLPEGASATAAA